MERSNLPCLETDLPAAIGYFRRQLYNAPPMTLGYIGALTLLHKTFRDHPARQRLHILLRFLSAPFMRTMDVIPRGSRVLDVGAGHGTYARLIVEERAREVVALEPDIRKAMTAFRHPKVRFVAGYDDCLRGTFEVVVMYDVIYRLSSAERDAVFKRLLERLKPGGLFVIKDMDPSRRLKWQWNRLQEAIMDRFLGLTIGEGLHTDTIEQMQERMTRAGFTAFEWKRVDSGYPHAHILYTARRPA